MRRWSSLMLMGLCCWSGTAGERIQLSSHTEQERKHIQGHLEGELDTEAMDEEELHFHYFRIHDTDRNEKLDGCELIHSLLHWHPLEVRDQVEGDAEVGVFRDEELSELIDAVLGKSDKDGDGYLNYREYRVAQAEAAASFTPPIPPTEPTPKG